MAKSSIFVTMPYLLIQLLFMFHLVYNCKFNRRRLKNSFKNVLVKKSSWWLLYNCSSSISVGISYLKILYRYKSCIEELWYKILAFCNNLIYYYVLFQFFMEQTKFWVVSEESLFPKLFKIQSWNFTYISVLWLIFAIFSESGLKWLEMEP